jgi:hypothetical protein
MWANRIFEISKFTAVPQIDPKLAPVETQTSLLSVDTTIQAMYV